MSYKDLALAIVGQAVKDHEQDIVSIKNLLKKKELSKKDLDRLEKKYGDIIMNRKFFKGEFIIHKSNPIKTEDGYRRLKSTKRKNGPIQYNLMTDVDGGRLVNAIEKRLNFDKVEDKVVDILEEFRQVKLYNALLPEKNKKEINVMI